jgi:hypothetical protein
MRLKESIFCSKRKDFFAHIFPVLKENENERRILVCVLQVSQVHVCPTAASVGYTYEII